jgi:hypothetical protein
MAPLLSANGADQWLAALGEPLHQSLSRVHCIDWFRAPYSKVFVSSEGFPFMTRRLLWIPVLLAAVVGAWLFVMRSMAPPILRATLTVEQARSLVYEHEGKEFISLHHLTSLTPEVAEVLAETKCGIIFYRLRTLSPAAAAALARHEGVALKIAGPTILSEATVRELSAYKGGTLNLEGIEALSAEAKSLLRENPAIMLPER